jgi:hypothetical protein
MHFYDKAVYRQLAEDTDRSESVNERIGLLAAIEIVHRQIEQALRRRHELARLLRSCLSKPKSHRFISVFS